MPPASAPGAAPSTRARARPEVLAPAGDFDCVRAAVENGADAVYFGLRRWNARARAPNFAIEELPDLLSFLRLRGVKGYVTLNTLIYADELDDAARTLERVIAAAPDAIILQDPGVARLARAISPGVTLHASTQTTTTCAESMEALAELGFSRVILARELTLRDIRGIAAATVMELEVFVHGALCVAYSGQCLTSEALGGRSANRGACAQACRLPYELIVDGNPRDLGERKYLLSPQDLAAYELVPDLVDAGVAGLKIEGRLKTPEYVAATTKAYRKAVDEAWAGRAARWSRDEVLDLQQVFTRGFSNGFLAGVDHQALIPGLSPKKRGPFAGRVAAIRAGRVRLRAECPLKPGDGVAFDYGSPDSETGGAVYEIWRDGRRLAAAAPGDDVELAFGEIDGSRVHVGDRVWKTSDPAVERRLRASFERVRRRVPVDALLRGVPGLPLSLELTDGTLRATAATKEPLAEAATQPLTEEAARAQVERLGETPFELRGLAFEVDGRAFAPVSALNDLRRRAAAELERVRRDPPTLAIQNGALEWLREAARPTCEVQRMRCTRGPAARVGRQGLSNTLAGLTGGGNVELVVLCRSMEQFGAALDEGCRHVELEFDDFRAYREVVAEARRRGAWIALAPPRIHKPGEGGILKLILSCAPDAVLARNLAQVEVCRGRVPIVADYALNAANDLTVDWLLARGVDRFTPSYDLDVEQLDALLARVPADRAEVVIHQRMPLFHLEHCVIAAALSKGHDATDCGRPCDRHRLALRDRVGVAHPLRADAGCRNTVFYGVAQSASPHVRRFRERGVRWFRVELLDEDRGEAVRLIRGYGDLLAGRADGHRLWRDLRASNVFGVTVGPLAHREAT